jgi:hypothetical protein
VNFPHFLFVSFSFPFEFKLCSLPPCLSVFYSPFSFPSFGFVPLSRKCFLPSPNGGWGLKPWGKRKGFWGEAAWRKMRIMK